METIQLIDTHCHLTFEQYEGKLEEVLERSRQAGVDRCITVGTDVKDSINAVILANMFDDLYATAGIHPHEAKDTGDVDLKEIRELAKEERVVAIGEMGLDYHYDLSPRDEQKTLFIEQLKISEESGLPAVVHSREAFEDTLEILEKHADGVDKIVFHCFGGDAEQAKIVVEHGWYVSFTGVVTFKNAHLAREAAAVVPLERLMIETDCPFMSPAPKRSQKTNEPGLMVHTARKLAEVKGVSLEELARQTTENAIEFFNL